MKLPAEVRDYPTAISQAVSALRLAGVGGPHTLARSAEPYTLVSDKAEYGYPIREHIARVVDGEIVWASAIDGAFLLSTCGGDFEPHLVERARRLRPGFGTPRRLRLHQRLRGGVASGPGTPGLDVALGRKPCFADVAPTRFLIARSSSIRSGPRGEWLYRRIRSGDWAAPRRNISWSLQLTSSLTMGSRRTCGRPSGARAPRSHA
jgi:Encapsulating protein for peroxidase